MNIDDLEGVIQDTTGDVIFNVRFDVIAFKPDKSEVLDGVVDSVDNTGIIVFSGPLHWPNQILHQGNGKYFSIFVN